MKKCNIVLFNDKHVNITHFIQVSQSNFHLSYTFFTHDNNQFQKQMLLLQETSFKQVLFSLFHDTKSWTSLEKVI